MALADIKSFVEVGDGIATGGQPSEAQLKDVAWAGYGVVINLGLLDPKYCLPDEAGVVAALGLEYHHIPVVFTDPKPDELRRFVDLMSSRRGERVFVHCAMNFRVSTFVALYGEMRLGWSRSKADAHMRRFWELNDVWTNFVHACRTMDRNEGGGGRQKCPGCGAETPDVEGSTDPYGGASAGCWAMFGEVCAKDYGDYGYPDVHRLLVDAYMAQHPNFARPAGRRSVALHLVGLCCRLEEGLVGAEAHRAMDGLFPDKRDTPALEPVPWLGEVTIAAVRAARNLEEHQDQATRLARAVWRAWEPFHPRIKQLRWQSRDARTKPTAGRKSPG